MARGRSAGSKIVVVALLLFLIGCTANVPKFHTLTLPSARECSYEPECKIIAIDSNCIVIEVSRHVDMFKESWYEYCMSLSWCSKKREWLLGYPDRTVPYPSPVFSCKFIGKAIR